MNPEHESVCSLHVEGSHATQRFSRALARSSACSFLPVVNSPCAAAMEVAGCILRWLDPWFASSGARVVRPRVAVRTTFPGAEVGLYGRALRDGDDVVIVATGQLRTIDYWIGSPTRLWGTAWEGMQFFQDTGDEEAFGQDAVVSVREWNAARRVQRWWRRVRYFGWRRLFVRLRCLGWGVDARRSRA